MLPNETETKREVLIDLTVDFFNDYCKEDGDLLIPNLKEFLNSVERIQNEIGGEK